MDRAQLEAMIWRHLAIRASGHITEGELVDAILDAADVYALAAYGITADRRAELAANAYLRREVAP